MVRRRILDYRLSGAVRRELQGTSLSDLLADVERLDEARSMMAGI